jgi:hypothetical protein
MIVLSGMTGSAVLILFGAFVIVTVLPYFLLYKALRRSVDIRNYFDRHKEDNEALFYVVHIALYILFCFILFGILAFIQYIFG